MVITTIYLLIALVQGQGYVAASHSTAAACEEDRQEALKMEDVLMTSECVAVVITPREKAKENAQK